MGGDDTAHDADDADSDGTADANADRAADDGDTDATDDSERLMLTMVANPPRVAREEEYNHRGTRTASR